MQIELPGINEAEIKEFTPLDPGMYQVQISRAETMQNDKGNTQLKVVFRVVNGPAQQRIMSKSQTNSPVGEELWDFFALTEKAIFRVKQLFVATGILSKDGTLPSQMFDLDQLLNKTANVELYKEEYQGKQQTRVKYLFA